MTRALIAAALTLSACSPQRIAKCEDGAREDWMPTYEVCEFLETAEAGGPVLLGGAK
jgi:hypothetical protein